MARCFYGALRRFAPVMAITLVAATMAIIGGAARASARIDASILIDATTGKVLSAHNADVHVYPASLTKLMTLYLLFNALDKHRVTLNTMFTVSAHAAAQQPSKLGFIPGQKISVRDAIEAIVTKSANDVAVAVSENLGGTEAHFVQEMNREARQLGMTNTVYRNASGLPNRYQHTTARDMAILARDMIRNHWKYYHFFSVHRFVWHGQVIPTLDRLVVSYPGADGLKTGFIDASGFNLVSSAVRGGHRLIGVIFGGITAARRNTHMEAMLDRGFAQYGLPPAAPLADRLYAERHHIRMARRDYVEPAVFHPAVQRRVAARPASNQEALAHRIALQRERLRRMEARLERMRSQEAARRQPPAPRRVAARRHHIVIAGRSHRSAWGIQVGAYGQYRPARRAVTVAVHKLGPNVRIAATHVARRRYGRNFLYEARLFGFTLPQARAACMRLQDRGQDCALVAPAA